MHSRTLPNFCISGRPLEEVGGVVVHYFSGKNVDVDKQYELEVCRDLFLDLNRPKEERELYMHADNWPNGRMYASAHLLVGRGGEVWKLVEFDKQAYHAGASILGGRKLCNRWTIGVELVGTNDSGFTDDQYTALAELLVDLMNTYDFQRTRIAGHDTVRHAAIQAGDSTKKKYDPSGRSDGLGDNFDWAYLEQLMDQRLEVLNASVTAP